MKSPTWHLCLVLLGLGLGAGVSGCAHTETTWTPETVRPPAPAESSVDVVPALDTRAESLAIPESLSEPVALTRDGALLTSLLNNRRIEVARSGPEIDTTYIDENRALFDPRILAQLSRGRSSRQSFGFSGSSGSASSGATSGAKALTLSSVEELLLRVQQLNQSIDALGGSSSTVVGSSGSVELQQYLPTGTLLFLTGAGARLDSNPSGDTSQHSWTAGISQPLLRGAGSDTNLAALRQAKNTAAQSEFEFRGTVTDVVHQTERAYWELVLAREVLGIRALGVRLAEEQMTREQGLQSVGKALNGDVMSADAERSARQADLVDAQAAMKTQAIELTRLMHPEATPRWELSFEPKDGAEVVEVQTQPEESERLAMQYRPELAQARLTLANLELDVVRARNGKLPQLNVVGEYEDSNGSASGGDDDTYSVGLQFETALFNRAERARFRRAQLSKERGADYIAQLEEEIAAEVHQALVEVSRQWERLAATAQAVLSRNEAVRVIEGRHEVGKATNLEVLQVQRDFIQAQVDDATARVRYIEALTSLYAAEGTLLERRGISTADLAENSGQQESVVDHVE